MSAFSMNATPLRPRRTRMAWMMWVPFVVLVLAGALAASGFSVSQKAFGLGSNVTVTATVGPDIHFTGTPCGAASINLAAGNITPGSASAPKQCDVVFGTNNDTNGAKLQINNNNAGKFFCKSPHTCAASQQFNDAPGTGGALAADEFGFKAVNTTNSALYGGFGLVNYYGVPAAATDFCQTGASKMTDATCTLNFSAYPSTVQALTYDGVIAFTATAL